MYAWLRRKKIRNEMDLLELGVRKRSNAFKLMAAIRDTDMEHWSKIDEAGCVMLGVFCVHRSSLALLVLGTACLASARMLTGHCFVAVWMLPDLL